jgi:two-component system cell cycle sensor histidine kinase/response regulator CckA
MSSPIRLLLVDDSVTDVKLVVQALRGAGLEVVFERVESAGAMRASLEKDKWDAVLCDWSMPKFSAMGALSVIKEMKLDLPFILVSGTIGEEAAVDAMRAGAHDYVIKDKLARLAPALEREIRDGVVRDARRRSEASLRIQEARFRALAESGIVGIATAEQTGDFVEANDTFLAMVGYSREDLAAGKLCWRDMTPPEFQHLNLSAAEQLRTRGFAAPWEKEYIRKDGSRVPCLVGLTPLDSSHTVLFAVDLTERRRMEAALHASESHLRQAQKMEAVGRLAGGVAHDFNNVLSVILSYCSLISENLRPDEPLRDDIEEIAKAGRRAADLTRQLLLFSRQQGIETKVIDLNDVLANMGKMVRRIVGEDVEVKSTVASGVGRVRADPSSVEQVIMNLVVNARDAMPTGGTLTMETANVTLDREYAFPEHEGPKAGPYVMLAVTDTGTGMDQATQARIFEPFFTTKEVGKGTGLGLSTVFGIVQQSGGTVRVESEPGHGASFKVYLPRVDEKLDSERMAVAPKTLHGTETILLVEDDDQLRVVARGIIRRCGYEVFEARNGGEALLFCEQHGATIHLLLSDVVMPKMSGPELAKRLVKVHPEMRVLCMSGYTDDSVFRHGMVDARFPFLQKPFTPESLARKVREVLDGPKP